MKNSLPNNLKDKIYTVLVEPQGSGNIGSVARSIMNSGMKNLCLINPTDYGNNEALSMACKANQVLDNAHVFESLTDCLKNETVNPGLVVGVTRRSGKMRGPIYSLTEIVPHILKFVEDNNVALLFGREDKGLLNDEISRCDMILEIPTSDDYPSINLAHAVTLVLHKLYTEVTEQKKFSIPGESVRVVSRAEIEDMYDHLDTALRQLGYGTEDRGGEHLLETIMRNFRRLFGRTGIIEKEMNMLRGIFAKIEQKCDPDKRD